MNIEQRAQLALAGHALAKKLNAGGDMSFIEVANLVADMSTQLDVTTAALREMTKQRDALATMQQQGIRKALDECSEYLDRDCISRQ